PLTGSCTIWTGYALLPLKDLPLVFVRLSGLTLTHMLKHLCLHRFKSERATHGREAAAMNRERAEFVQGAIVCGRRVAFVCGATVAGIELIKLAHICVARRLGDERGGGD